MGNDDGQDDEGPLFAWLPPEDRLWRHPSEMPTAPDVPVVEVAASQPPAPARVWTVAVAAGLAGALLTSGLFLVTGALHPRTTRVIEPVATPSSILATDTRRSGQPNWASVADTLAASVVGISTTNPSASGNQTGSGVLWTAGGSTSYVLTASDLFSGGGDIDVSFNDGESQRAKLIGADQMTGVAVLAVPGTDHTFPTFGSVSNVVVAEPILAVGARLANTSNVASGAVSGLDEAVPDDNGATLFGMLAMSGISVSASTDGGAVVDAQGEVIGIDSDVSPTMPQQQDAAYAAPINVVVHVAEQILVGARPTHPWIGIEDATDLSTVTAHQLGVSGGAQIGSVAPQSPAARAGLGANDIVTGFDNRPVASSGTLITLLSQCNIHQRVKVTYLHHGDKRSTTLAIVNEPGVVNP